LLEARGIRKRFGGVEALKGVDFDVAPGRVHALLGENGAGKSTLVKLLGGALVPDAGEIRWRGAPVVLKTPGQGRNLGIRTIHQELELAAPLSVAENVFLGALPAQRGWLARSEMVRRAGRAISSLGGNIDPRAPVRELGVGDRQLVEIARAVVGEARVLFMDEPTAALTQHETDRLFSLIRQLTASGTGIVYISHRLDEVLAISDTISVMRDGSLVASFVAGATRAQLVEAILGHPMRESAEHQTTVAPQAERCVSVRDLSLGSALASVNFDARAGEIVGLFGLLGAGQEAFVESLFGLHPDATAARATIGKSKGGLPKSPAAAIRAGVGFVPADRKRDGLILGLSIFENLELAQRASKGSVLVDRSQAAQRARALIARYDIRVGADIDRAVGTLSGGNQQKVALAKWAPTGARILVLAEPTRGVDVGARAEIYGALRTFVAAGGSVILASTDAEEILAACDSVHIFRRGRIARHAPVAAFPAAADLAAAAF
jgi:ABC-type sugar transport system ATPase subunit